MPFFERPCILRDTLEYLSIYLSIEKMVEPLVGNSWLSASQSSRTERRHSVAPYPFRCTTYQTRQYRRICKRSTFPFAWMGKPWWEGIVDGSKWFRLRSSQLASTFIGWNPLSNPRLFFLLPRRDFLLFRNRSEGFIGQNEGLLGWIDLRRSRSIAPIDAWYLSFLGAIPELWLKINASGVGTPAPPLPRAVCLVCVRAHASGSGEHACDAANESCIISRGGIGRNYGWKVQLIVNQMDPSARPLPSRLNWNLVLGGL